MENTEFLWNKATIGGLWLCKHLVCLQHSASEARRSPELSNEVVPLFLNSSTSELERRKESSRLSGATSSHRERTVLPFGSPCFPGEGWKNDDFIELALHSFEFHSGKSKDEGNTYSPGESLTKKQEASHICPSL